MLLLLLSCYSALKLVLQVHYRCLDASGCPLCPAGMKALVCKQLGHPLATDDKKPLKLVQNHPKPSPSLPANGVRIRVTAAALNFADALQIQARRGRASALPLNCSPLSWGHIVQRMQNAFLLSDTCQ